MRRAPWGKPNHEVTGMWAPDNMLGDMLRKVPPASPTGAAWCLSQKTTLMALGIEKAGHALLGIKTYGRDWRRRQIRCPRCGRRILPVSIHCIGGEFICWALPPHKELAKKKAKPKRKVRAGRLP